VTAAARELIGLLERLERDSTSVMELICGSRTPEPWKLYPDDCGTFSIRTRSQFYYHVHGGAQNEAGHFHTVRFFPDRTAHIVAISMAPSGWPQALFTVNLWAIGDAYEPVEKLKSYARRFQIEESRGEPRVVRFVNLVFRLLLPEIERLQEEKAAALAAFRMAHPNVNPFEDRALEVTSRVEIDVRARLRA
jgi:Domain of unknown function (DUF6969)